VLEGLARLVKGGRLGRLEVINASVEPELAARHGVRAVPWTRIGSFDLTGALTPSELADWVELAASGEGWSAYYAHLLENRRLEEVEQRIRERPSTLVDLIGLLAEEDIPMSTRIGVSAVVEELHGTRALAAAVPELEQLTLSASPQTRGDACHFLGLAGERRAIPAVRRLLEDDQPDVREIAIETLALLGEGRDP
jgi:HEAT repeat protein